MSYLKKLNDNPELLKKFKGLPTTEEEIEALKTISKFTDEQIEALKNLLPTEEERENSKATTLKALEEVKLLREEIKQLKTEKESKAQKTSLPKQLLMMHYLGFIGHYTISDTKKGKLFSKLLNGDENNIRTALPNFIGKKLRIVSNLKHLDELAELFRETGLINLSQEVEKDIVKLKTGKL